MMLFSRYEAEGMNEAIGRDFGANKNITQKSTSCTLVPTITMATNITWHQGHITRDQRERQLNQRGVTLWFTGLR